MRQVGTTTAGPELEQQHELGHHAEGLGQYLVTSTCRLMGSERSLG
jgi:hypothetical protein